MKYLVIPFILLSTSAFAQEAPKTFSLVLDMQEIAVVGKGLGMLPYGEVAPLMQKLQIQINQQQQIKKPSEAGEINKPAEDKNPK